MVARLKKIKLGQLVKNFVFWSLDYGMDVKSMSKYAHLYKFGKLTHGKFQISNLESIGITLYSRVTMLGGAGICHVRC
jgi:hypothetical protein